LSAGGPETANRAALRFCCPLAHRANKAWEVHRLDEADYREDRTEVPQIKHVVEATNAD